MANVQQSLPQKNYSPVNTNNLPSWSSAWSNTSAPKNTALQNKVLSTPNPSSGIQSQILSLQSKIDAAKNAGYSGSQQIQTDQNGNVVAPKQPGIFQQAVTGLTATGQGQNASGVNGSAQYLQGQANTNASANQQNIQKSAGMLGNFAQNQSPEVQKQTAAYNQFAQENPYMLAAQSNPNVAADVASGRTGLLGNIFANELNAKQQAVTNAYTGQGQQINAAENLGTQGLTGQQQQIGAATNAGNLGVAQQNAQITALNASGNLAQPVQVPYSNQYINPVTGQPVTGGETGGTSAMSQLPQNAQNAVSSYAQQVQSGKMTRLDAESRLASYGIAGTNALNEVLGPEFNTNASNASAATTATGQQIQTAADATNKALNTLSSLFSNLSQFQTGGIPATNNLANWIAAQFGDKALNAYQTNLSDARSQLIGVLNASGGTSTGNEETANKYLPDNMTKDMFDTNVGTPDKPGIVRELVTQKVGSFTSSGQQNASQQTGTNVIKTAVGSVDNSWFQN